MLASGFSDAIGALLNGLGTVLAWLYQVVRNYGLAIILLTVGIRILLIPLAIKQIRSMQAMQAVQPRVKALQQKYKGKGPEGRQKLNEEMMALYKEHGVNPFSGCLPLLAQFPVLIALFAVLKVPGGAGHVPAGSELRSAITAQHTTFLGTNLLCSAAQAGKQVVIQYKKADQKIIQGPLNCGSGGASRLPYYAFALAMLGTTYYQQRQMTKATPGGSQQQQALTKFMPLLFGFWGYLFPAGLVVYWTTTNLVQIAQQQFMLPRIRDAQDAVQSKGRGSQGDGRVKELGRGRQTGGKPGPSDARKPGQPMKPRQGSSTGGSGTGRRATGRPSSGQRPASGSRNPGGEGSREGGTGGGQRPPGGGNAGDRKKRRKR